jgi:hypothetical protein
MAVLALGLEGLTGMEAAGIGALGAGLGAGLGAASLDHSMHTTPGVHIPGDLGGSHPSPSWHDTPEVGTFIPAPHPEPFHAPPGHVPATPPKIPDIHDFNVGDGRLPDHVPTFPDRLPPNSKYLPTIPVPPTPYHVPDMPAIPPNTPSDLFGNFQAAGNGHGFGSTVAFGTDAKLGGVDFQPSAHLSFGGPFNSPMSYSSAGFGVSIPIW